MSRSTLEAAIPAGLAILIDTSAVLAYLDGGESVSAASAVVMDDFVASGRNAAVVSAVTVTEALVRPMRAASASAVQLVESFLGHFSNLRVEAVTFDVGREAARIRAASALRTPDAMILATGVVAGTAVVVTNDGRWATAIAGANIGLALCRLDEHR